ncbi:MAG: glycosyltransferase, partial [Polyangiaceae bacterium]
MKKAALALAFGGVGYLGFALARVRRFRERTRQSASDLPGVSVLKPLHGVEPELFENLCSFCEQDYPNFEVIFGVHDGSDAAAPIAQSVVARYPDRTAIVMGNGSTAAGNPKVANLSRMQGRASQSILVLADADMRVKREYLREIVARFGDS